MVKGVPHILIRTKMESFEIFSTNLAYGLGVNPFTETDCIGILWIYCFAISTGLSRFLGRC